MYFEVFSFKFRAAWSDRLEYNKFNLHAFPVYFNVIILHSFTTTRAPEEKNMISTLLGSAILKKLHICGEYIYPNFSLAVHDLNPLAV